MKAWTVVQEGRGCIVEGLMTYEEAKKLCDNRAMQYPYVYWLCRVESTSKSAKHLVTEDLK